MKYTPTVVLGLLVVAWVISIPRVTGYSYTRAADVVHPRLSPGTVSLAWISLQGKTQPSFGYHRYHGWGRVKNSAGRFEVKFAQERGYFHIYLPIPLLVTLGLPLAIGPFISFRFRLWHYLAYTAIVAVELAYYLRWQE